MLLNTLKKFSLFFVIVFYCNTYYAQNNEVLINYKDLDSLHKLYYGKSSNKAYSTHQELLVKSFQISYVKGELSAYKALMWYHGTNPKADLDSVLYYANLFERRIEEVYLHDDTLLMKSLKLPEYYLNKGQILANGFGLPEQALESYFKLYPLIPKENKQLSINYYISISEIYFQKFQYDKALEVLIPILKDTVGVKTEAKIKLLTNISANYMKKKMHDKSFILHKKILKLTKEINDVEGVWWVKDELAYDYFNMGDYQKAIDSALVVRDYCVKNNFHQLIFNNTTNLSTYYHVIGDLDKAIAYRKEALKFSPGLEFKKNAYNKLAGYYIDNEQYLDAIDMYNKNSKAIDSLRSIEKKMLTNYIDSKERFFEEKQRSQHMLFDLKLLEVKNKKQNIYIFSISIVLVSIILFLVSVLVFRKYRKGEKVIENLKSNEKKILEEKIVLRENELEASAIALSQRLEILTSIKNELNEIKKPKILKLEKVKLKINNLIKSASDMSIITKRIESEHPTMAVKLLNKYPNLSDTQIRYCLLTKLNLSIKETAIILNVTPDTVKVARSRLKKKLEVPSETSIKVFLDDLSK